MTLVSNLHAVVIGGNLKDTTCLFDRVSSLIADILGLFGDRHVRHHSGGQSIWSYCLNDGTKPLDLYLGWVLGVPCRRCAEYELYLALKPTQNKNPPSRCKKHKPILRACLPDAIG